MEVDLLLTLVVPVADDNEMTVLLHLLDLVVTKVVGPQMLRDQIPVWAVDCGKVDEQRNRSTLFVLGPQ